MWETLWVTVGVREQLWEGLRDAVDEARPLSVCEAEREEEAEGLEEAAGVGVLDVDTRLVEVLERFSKQYNGAYVVLWA